MNTFNEILFKPNTIFFEDIYSKKYYKIENVLSGSMKLEINGPIEFTFTADGPISQFEKCQNVASAEFEDILFEGGGEE